MANIKSAKKRVQVTAVRTERNKAIRSEVKTYVKRVEAAVESGDKAVAESELKAAIKVIEMAGSKGVYHDNTVSRKVSRLTKLVNKLA
ncbi:MAG: 30S ribosomal protein S20 [Pseudobutyrivibrio sp.]|uniref:30S ribosomal protein S20 n=1 Tax=Pseudobutyrivibrio sp. TaxID=2014367 RepID=UPI001B1009EE|nr:30S ribosomal protein S20 [Pseudobutyrivibrio sp.]MBE5917552.1 30S ribosomal protein S20 [Pseudobutyrivibrio ruminis]MBO5616813.1 30S ribosomal protein S20 [Pseudobutyrivibrio sp.]MBP3262179.1 30S ribosomal protein S20 [Pseudobutyrivibrio sp.]MBQ3774370.1 30S ribosomal protein S20 [Pseudobutyrivibrio sp.]MBQ6463648.1 30S ribosomal protein S20 [Pseudobutyrivibrio sp.]